MKSSAVVLMLILVVAGCRPNPELDAETDAAPAPAAAIALAGESQRLEDRLDRIDAEIEAMLEDGFDEARATAGMLRAEALTDRLLEAEPPVEWLAHDYSLEARLRQLQALADRIVAALRRGDEAVSITGNDAATQRAIRDDIRRLQRDVKELRQELAQPGAGRAPVPIDSLLKLVSDKGPASPVE